MTGKSLKRMVNSSQPNVASRIAEICPLPSYLAFSCLYKHVFFPLVMSHPVPSWPWVKVISLPRASLQVKVNILLCSQWYRRMQSLYNTPGSVDACITEEMYFCIQTHTHTHRGRLCVVTGDDKWSGTHLAWWSRLRLARWSYMHTTLLLLCISSLFDLFSLLMLSHCVIAFRNWQRQPEKHAGSKVGQFLIQPASHLSCLVPIKSFFT